MYINCFKSNSKDSANHLKDGSGEVSERRATKVIQYRKYGFAVDPVNYYREQAMLYIPWRNEDEELLTIDCKAKCRKHAIQVNERSLAYNPRNTVNIEDFLDNKSDDEEENEVSQIAEESVLFSDKTFSDIFKDMGIDKSSSKIEKMLCPKFVDKDEYDKLMRSLNKMQRK